MRACRQVLPSASIYVYDNNSTDETIAAAFQAGAHVRREPRRGKGFVVAQMLTEIIADVYVLIDGDNTYSVSTIRELIGPILDGTADMVIGRRVADDPHRAFPRWHVTGNRLVRAITNSIFGASLRDIMSGYRTISRRLVDQVPIAATGFEIEVELTLNALARGFVVTEVPVAYQSRPAGSYSKLRTYVDGPRVLWKIVEILQTYRPLLFFGAASGILACLATLITMSAFSATAEKGSTGLLQLVSAAVLGTVAISVGACGLVLKSINSRLNEEFALMRHRTSRSDARTSSVETVALQEP